MYIQSTRSKSVSLATFAKAIVYAYLAPQNGFFEKLKERFGSSAQLYLNSEVALTLLIKYLPGRMPGMYIALDERMEKRFKKIITRLGMKVLVYSGQKELAEACTAAHVLAILVPDSYAATHEKYKKRYEESRPIKIIYQNRMQPKSVDMHHDVYIWEPKNLPRSVSGSVVVCAGEQLSSAKQQMKEVYSAKVRLSAIDFISELWRAFRGYENRFRRIDRRPPRILARLLYDMYSSYE